MLWVAGLKLTVVRLVQSRNKLSAKCVMPAGRVTSVKLLQALNAYWSAVVRPSGNFNEAID